MSNKIAYHSPTNCPLKKDKKEEKGEAKKVAKAQSTTPKVPPRAREVKGRPTKRNFFVGIATSPGTFGEIVRSL